MLVVSFRVMSLVRGHGAIENLRIVGGRVGQVEEVGRDKVGAVIVASLKLDGDRRGSRQAGEDGEGEGETEHRCEGVERGDEGM